MLSDQLLAQLPPFSNKEKILIKDQNVDDIINAIVKAQKKYQKDYYHIYTYFVGSNEIETARNVWNFLKKNVDYVIELDTQQTIKSPAAILSTSKKKFGGNDCKNFALFTAGALSAYRDNELKDFDLYFRFASYDYFDRIPQHVYVVMKIGNKEIWIDPVLDQFDEHRQPTYFIDKKINQMALVALSGIYNQNNTNQPTYTDFGTVTGTISDFNRIGFTIPFVGIDSKDAIDIAKKGVDIVKDLTKLFENKPNPNDWQGWEAQERAQGMPLGTSANFFTKYDGDSIQNEGINIISWIKKYGIDTVTGYNSWNKWTVSIDDIVAKLNRGGLDEESGTVKKILTNTGSDNNTQDNTQEKTLETKQAGMNIFVTLAFVGVGIFALTKLKK